MARKADGAGKVRSELEGASLAFVDWQEVEPFIRLRIQQAMRRDAQLCGLLSPALEDLERMSKSIGEAKSLITAATVKLMER